MLIRDVEFYDFLTVVVHYSNVVRRVYLYTVLYLRWAVQRGNRQHRDATPLRYNITIGTYTANVRATAVYIYAKNRSLGATRARVPRTQLFPYENKVIHSNRFTIVRVVVLKSS